MNDNAKLERFLRINMDDIQKQPEGSLERWTRIKTRAKLQAQLVDVPYVRPDAIKGTCDDCGEECMYRPGYRAMCIPCRLDYNDSLEV